MKRMIITACVAVLTIVTVMVIWKMAHKARPQYVIAKRAVPAAMPKKKAALPPAAKKAANPKVVIVMDDFGYNKNNLDIFFGINKPITLSVLPDEPYSKEVAREAKARGYEVILHLPLEPKPAKSAVMEADTIKTGMTDKEIVERLDKCINAVPGIVGISNHQGSKATEDKRLMSVIMAELKKRNLYFFDSLTTERSVCKEAAARAGVRYARRDVFLDIPDDPVFFQKQLLRLKKIAFAKGKAIAVCHDKKNTIAALARAMPQMSAEGIEFVRLAELEK